MKVVILLDGLWMFMAIGYISQLDLGPRWLLLPEPELQDRGEAHTDDESGTSDAAGCNLGHGHSTYWCVLRREM